MQIVSVKNPQYASSNRTAIRCFATFDDGSSHSFTATVEDTEAHGAALWNSLVAGKYGAIAPYVERQPPGSKAKPAVSPDLVSAVVAHLQSNPAAAAAIVVAANLNAPVGETTHATSLNPNR